MKPISPPSLVDKGIVVYSPAVDGYRYLKIEILYSKNNPIFPWSSCDAGEAKLWSTISEVNKSGTLFIYDSKFNLEEGFYKILLSAYNSIGSNISGSLTIGLIEPKPKLIIGTPYSTYNPIPLS